MKEFDKKSSPGREGFSKFLPASMSDSSTRRRLTEYEIQLQDLQAYIRSLEAETPPKDLTTLTFFFTAAYTRSATDELEHERRTRGQERRDGL